MILQLFYLIILSKMSDLFSQDNIPQSNYMKFEKVGDIAK
jgi:hypothetical protein